MDAFPVICLIMPFLVALGGEPQVPRKELTLPGVLSRVEAAYPKVKGIARKGRPLPASCVKSKAPLTLRSALDWSTLATTVRAVVGKMPKQASQPQPSKWRCAVAPSFSLAGMPTLGL